MKLTEIQDLIKFVSKSGVNEVELETSDIKIVIRTGKAAAPVMYQQAPVQLAQAPAAITTAVSEVAPASPAAPVAARCARPHRHRRRRRRRRSWSSS